jgi:hypothetical protein
MRLRHTIAALAACSAIAIAIATPGVAGAATSNAVNPGTCTGGTLAAGNYDHLTITGVCSMPDSGKVHIRHGVTIAPGAALNAITPAIVTVHGGIKVGAGAILGLGCSPMIDCTVTTNDRVFGDLVARDAAAVILHSDSFHGNVSIKGGGGGVNCDNNPATGGPLYFDVEDSHLYGSLSITDLQTCWLGIIRDHVKGSVTDKDNTMADPDANEVVTNQIVGNLNCSGNSPVAQIGDSGGSPNKVGGHERGECAAA